MNTPRDQYCCDELTALLLNPGNDSFRVQDGRPQIVGFRWDFGSNGLEMFAVKEQNISHCPFHGTDLKVNPCSACHQEPCVGEECALSFPAETFAEHMPVAEADGGSRPLGWSPPSE